uniref:Uncharacterized protein n=1 Tax=viral metagenome TaxID=1070528 RepID=A0A6M3LIX7_9ZZZZ
MSTQYLLRGTVVAPIAILSLVFCPWWVGALGFAWVALNLWLWWRESQRDDEPQAVRVLSAFASEAFAEDWEEQP